MNFAGQMVVAGGLILFGSAFLPNGEALAFGQQWRPAAGLAAVQGGPYRRVSNVPSFRPWTVARGAYGERRDRARRSPPRPPQPPAPPRYMAAHAAVPLAAGLPPAGYAPAMRSFPGGAQPFSGMVHAWQLLPPPAHQFAWRRPVEPQWVVSQTPRYGMSRKPGAGGTRAARAGYRPAYGSWRPAGWPAATVHDRVAYQLPDYGRSSRPVFRSVRPAVRPTVAAPDTSPLSAAPALAQDRWRPEAAQRPSAWDGGDAFRPLASARKPVERRVASRGATGLRASAHASLPGWVTTHPDHPDACGWCNGS